MCRSGSPRVGQSGTIAVMNSLGDDDDPSMSWEVREVRGMSQGLTISPEEFIGRWSQTLTFGGFLERVAGDASAPVGYSAWAARILAIVREPGQIDSLRQLYLTPDEIKAAENYDPF
jgi:hypothetical protein